MTSLTLVGLSGGAGVGKDYLAREYFYKEYGYRPAGLADALKERVMAIAGYSHEEVFVTKPPEVRTLLQIEGTENGWMKYGEQYWCRLLLGRLQTARLRWGEEFSRYVITDVRFPHEVDFIHRQGGVVFRIEAPVRYKLNGMSVEARSHASERALDAFVGFDGVIHNDLTDEPTITDQIRRLLSHA